jgi:hypothetical protein
MSVLFGRLTRVTYKKRARVRSSQCGRAQTHVGVQRRPAPSNPVNEYTYVDDLITASSGTHVPTHKHANNSSYAAPWAGPSGMVRVQLRDLRTYDTSAMPGLHLDPGLSTPAGDPEGPSWDGPDI